MHPLLPDLSGFYLALEALANGKEMSAQDGARRLQTVVDAENGQPSGRFKGVLGENPFDIRAFLAFRHLPGR